MQEGGCNKDFDIPATKQLLATMQKLKHGFQILGTVGLSDKGKKSQQIVGKVKVDLEAD